jgi:uncharacterized RDD family membrane protein YckC
MVSTSKPAVAGVTVAAPSASTAQPVARLNARISAYLIDSIALLAVILAFFVISGAVLLFTSDLGKNDPPDSAFDAFVAVLLGGPLIFWSALNVALVRLRGQSPGMYLVGIRAVSADETALTWRRSLLRWFGLHPLLFHPFVLPVWVIFVFYAVSSTLSQVVLILTVALALLLLLAPAIGLLLLATDADRRALHDRLARTVVVHGA